MGRTFFALLCCVPLVAWAQQVRWYELLRDSTPRFAEIERAFERERHSVTDEEDSEEEGEEDFVHFGRWADFWRLRLMPDGSFPSGDILWQELQRKIADQRQRHRHGKGSRTQSSANFAHLGPTSVPSNGGAGRINCIAFHPTNSAIVFVGSPSGGLWKSTDGGSSWSSNTDTLAVLGVSAIAIDPSNPQVMYIGTGDRDARDTYGVGILKSTDGGATWNTTGLAWTTNQNRVVCEIVIIAGSPAVLLAATSNGIWRSTDGGQSWSQRTTAYTMELRVHPSASNIVLASTYTQTGGATIQRSTDGGVTWTTVWSNSAVNRVALALSPTAPRRVYALCSSASNNSFYGLYMSLDTGSTWSQQSSSPNILGSNTSGTSSGGQGWYDLCLAVHPTDSTMLFAGGVNIWRSTNAGQGWTIVSYWQTGSSIPYVHADQHCMLFKPGTTDLWVGNDGGVFLTTNLGSSWSDLSSGLAILQIYRMSHQRGSTTPTILAGTQDNGTNRRTSAGAWSQVYGGDGMENAIDWQTPTTMYCSIYYGSFYRSTNSGSSWSAIAPSGESGNGSWVTPFHMHPSNPQMLYAAYRTVYRSTNRGTNWSSLGTPLATNARATYMAVSPSDPNVLVVGTASSLYRTSNGGTSWANITGSLPSSISNAAFDPADTSILWVTCSNWVSGQKVFLSTTGGTTWSNVSTGLPNVPVNCIAIDPRTGNAYVGTDIGIYIRQPGASQWTSWDDGLPNVIVRDIELDTATGRIYAATYGRGIWQGTMLGPSLSAALWASRTSICTGDTVRFADASTGSISGRFWTFPGGSPASSTDSTVAVVFPNPGIYQITLVVVSGTMSDTARTTITVNQRPSASITLSATMVCEGDSIAATATGQNIVRYQWNTGDTTQRIILRAIGTYNLRVTVTNAAGCTYTTGVVQCSIVARPPVPTIAVTGRNPFCTGDSVTLEAPSGYAAYRWNTGATSQRITVTTAGDMTVTVTDANGCTRTSDTLRLIRLAPPPLTVQVNGLLTFCDGDSVVLMATSSPGATFFWLDGVNGSRRVIRTSGTYVVSVTDTNGCRAVSAPYTVSVAAKPAPVVTVIGSATLCPGDSVILDAGTGFAAYRWNTGDTAQRIVVRRAGQYWCVCTSTAGCRGTSDTVFIRQDTSIRPTIVSLSGRFRACRGDTIVLDAGQGYARYNWNTGATTRRIPITSDGHYAVFVRTTSGCSGWSDTVTVSFDDPPPTPSIERSGNELRSSIIAAQYQWYRNGTALAGATNRSYSPDQDGRYRVRITDTTGCWSESADYDFVASVAEVATPLTFELIPNPADDEVIVRFVGTTLSATVELYDLLGRRLAIEHIVGKDALRLDLSSVGRGTYVVVVRSGSQAQRQRLVRW